MGHIAAVSRALQQSTPRYSSSVYSSTSLSTAETVFASRSTCAGLFVDSLGFRAILLARRDYADYADSFQLARNRELRTCKMNFHVPRSKKRQLKKNTKHSTMSIFTGVGITSNYTILRCCLRRFRRRMIIITYHFLRFRDILNPIVALFETLEN